MRPVLLFLIATLLASRVDAKAPDSNAGEVKRHYERGLAHFNLREFEKAVEEFEAGYRLRPDPVFLYNLAQAHRLLEHHERALYFYRAYLRTSTDAPNRQEVEGRIATLEQVLATHKEAAKPPDTAMEPKVQHMPTASPIAVTTTHVDAEKSHRSSRKWIWPVVATGVVLVALSVGLGLGLGMRDQDPTPTFGTWVLR